MYRKIIPFFFSTLGSAAWAQPTPNILLIVADDLGYSDLAAYGNRSVRTPNIDRLGHDGVRFTNAFASSPISGPSRAGILTGRCQNRFGCEFMPYDHYDKQFMNQMKYYYWPYTKKPEGLKTLRPKLLINRAKHETDMPDTEITIAELLRKHGYTTGLVGKWNVGSNLETSPEEHGYDYSYYFSGALTRYVDDPVDTSKYVGVHLPWSFSELPAWQKRSGPTAIKEGSLVVADTGYLTFAFARKAVDFIYRNKDKPFFLTLAFNAPHDPFQAPRDYYERIDEKDPVKRVYYAMIEALDNAVGEVIDALEQNGLYEQTLIIFTSDNGGAAYTRATDNKPLKGGKCTLFNGGLEVPFYLKFPGNSHLLGMEYQNPVSTLDIYATIAAATRTPLPGDRLYDGLDLRPYLDGSITGKPHDEFFWRNGYVKACVVGDWKLYVSEKDKTTFLFDMAGDRDETNNLAEKYPGKVKELKNIYKNWEKTQTVKPLWPSGGNVLIKVDGKVFKFPV